VKIGIADGLVDDVKSWNFSHETHPDNVGQKEYGKDFPPGEFWHIQMRSSRTMLLV
jgi:hypothetical protein